MRFLFECVGCCWISTSPNSVSAEPSSPTTPKSEETRSLMTPAPAPVIKRRRKRASARAPAADWRPSLFAISEENAIAAAAPEKVDCRNRHAPVAVKPASAATAAAQRSVKRCGQSSARVNAARSHARDFSHDPLSMVVPAFSAAPFIF